jgi:DNA-directed RNA polymerase subunit RPC12/RpoP
MENSLAELRPELVTEWSLRNLPIRPEEISYGSKKMYWWKGACGHEWEASVKARSHGEKCPLCAGKRIVSAINDLASLMPELAVEWSEKNLMPANAVGIGSHKKAMWKGTCGHEWEALISTRSYGSKCPYCSGIKVLAGFNDLGQHIHNWLKNGPREIFRYLRQKSIQNLRKMCGGVAVPVVMNIWL